jgi:hypothetical protein
VTASSKRLLIPPAVDEAQKFMAIPFLTSKKVPLGAQHRKVGTSQTVITSKTDVLPQKKELNPMRQSGIRVVLYQNILGHAWIVPKE